MLSGILAPTTSSPTAAFERVDSLDNEDRGIKQFDFDMTIRWDANWEEAPFLGFQEAAGDDCNFGCPRNCRFSDCHYVDVRFEFNVYYNQIDGYTSRKKV